MSFVGIPLAADDLLQSGQWKGEYLPANTGADINATFCVFAADDESSVWKVTMLLDLPPPGNEPVEFEFVDSDEDTLKFRLDLLGALRECSFEREHESVLFFDCVFVDSESGSAEGLTMERAEPQPEGVCLPEDDDGGGGAGTES